MIQENTACNPQPPDQNYFRAEFQLRQPRIFYQFKVRKNDAEPLFAVVKEGSQALENLKAGDVIPMTYYFHDTDAPAEKRETRIKYITKIHETGFKGHFMVALDIQTQ